MINMKSLLAHELCLGVKGSVDQWRKHWKTAVSVVKHRVTSLIAETNCVHDKAISQLTTLVVERDETV